MIRLLLFFSFLFFQLTSYSQYVQRHTYRIQSNPTWTLGREDQIATAFTKLSDGGFCLGGQLEYWDHSHIQDQEYGRDFIMKIDSDFNYKWVDSGMIARDWPIDEITSIVETVDGIIAVFDSTHNFNYFSYLHSDSINGSSAWSKVLNIDTNSYPIFLNKIFDFNDTLYASGLYYNYTVSQSIPTFVVLKSNGDTILKREYSSYIGYPAQIDIQKDAFNNLYLLLQNQVTNVILHIDRSGYVLSLDTISALSSFPKIRVISPTKILLMDNINQWCYKILNNHGSLIDSIYVGCYINDFYTGNNGNILAFCQSNSISIFGTGNHIFNIDSLGNVQWSIRIDSSFIYCINEINSKIYASGTSGNSVDFLELSPPISHVLINTSLPFICSGDSVLLTASFGSHYYWSTGDTTQNIFIKAGGNYWAFVVDSEGGGVFSDTLTINVDNNSINLGSDTMICDNTAIVLDAGANFNSYHWQDGSQSQLYNILATGTDTLSYSCTVIDSNQCSFSDTMQVIFNSCLGVNTINQNNLSVYPNPVSSSCQIIFSNYEETNFTLSDFTGRIIGEDVIIGTSLIEMNDLSPGIYFLTLNSTQGKIIKKIIKE